MRSLPVRVLRSNVPRGVFCCVVIALQNAKTQIGSCLRHRRRLLADLADSHVGRARSAVHLPNLNQPMIADMSATSLQPPWTDQLYGSYFI